MTAWTGNDRDPQLKLTDGMTILSTAAPNATFSGFPRIYGG